MPQVPVRVRVLALVAAAPVLLPSLSQLPNAEQVGMARAFALAGAAFTLAMGIAYVAFWLWGVGGRRGLALAGLVVLLTIGSAINRGGPTYTAFIWLYPALIAGFVLRPWPALTSLAAMILLAAAPVASRDSGLGGDQLNALSLAGEVALLVLLAGLVSVTVAELLRSNAELRAARQELAKLAIQEERARFARDLHDLLGHTLSLVLVKVRLAARLASGGAAVDELHDVEKLAMEALEDIRSAAAGYRQPTLAAELAGADMALRAAGISLLVNNRAGLVTPQTEGALAWVVREAVTNVLRHSRAGKCRIAIERAEGSITIEVEDDGNGDDGSPNGSGLNGIRERVAREGGGASWKRPPQGGFVLTARLPTDPGTQADTR